jgi:transposase
MTFFQIILKRRVVMAGRRVSMRKIREVLRLNHERKLSLRQIAKSCSLARSTVQDYIRRAEEAGITWPQADDLDDTTLERSLYPPKESPENTGKAMPSMDYLYREMRRKGVTLQLLWYEYKQQNPEGYQYSYFSQQYREHLKRLHPVFRHRYRAGEKMFVDFAGQTVDIVSSDTGEIHPAQIFIAVLGASNYTYVEAFPSQDLPSWISAHVHAFSFFKGVAEITVPDNLKSGVTKPNFYEPDINPTYLDMARHYDTAVIPARPKSPRDKAKAETAVQVAERWILAAVRNHTFFSIAELNQAIKGRLIDLNDRPMQKIGKSRRELFEAIDRPALKPLPTSPYEFAEWKKARVNIDYHVQVDYAFYSVPYQLRREEVEVRLTSTTVEILFKNRRVASHCRSFKRGEYITLKEHMPKSHQKYLDWTPSRIIKWAAQNGPKTERLVSAILDSRPHPEQGFRSCLGIMRLGKQYGAERLEAASDRAFTIKAFSFKRVESILKNGLDQQELFPEESNPDVPSSHRNVRGKGYYH